MPESIIIFQLIILIMSVVIHEVSHGYAAELLGDPTPRLQGRLTLNPIKHLEWFGSFFVPIITSLAGFPFGWAKPVEWNPYNIADRRRGELLISLAGPASNVVVALVFGFIVRFFIDTLPFSFIQICGYIVIINIVLTVFNMIPIPPLDGSKVLFSILPPNMIRLRHTLERYTLIFFFLLVFVLWRFVEPVIPILFKFITGIGI